MRTLALSTLAACAALAVTAAPAAADSRNKDEARAEFDQAETHYKLGRFQEALDAYTRAYEIYPAPALLFDIGQCHRNLKNYERAIFFFEGYLRDETNPARRTLAEELIAESKAEIERQRAAAAIPPPISSDVATALAPGPAGSQTGQPGATPPPELSRPAASPTPALLEARPAPEPPQRPVTRRWWFWAGVGAVTVAAGAFAYYESGHTIDVLPGGTVGTLDRR
jgi:tetratricopeptide (TPR) repeat protein